MRAYFILFLTFISFLIKAQHTTTSSEIYHKMQKLNVLGNVLYLAAHPDDENTRFIAYTSNELLYNTSYMSLTRGSGGQNLIGPEIRDALGVIRTQELLQARKVDGGKQYFSRANDFGYSKTSTETMQIWDSTAVMEDIVWIIRYLRPDVIVLRFPPDSRGGHGHHTASAMMGIKAYELAADKNVFPEQLKKVSTWQVKRVVTNTGRWWDPDVSADDEGITAIDIGSYSELLGTSMNEIAAHARSQHKSQGFGTSPTRGEQLEYFEHQIGTDAKENIFEDIDDSWARVKGSKKIQELINSLLKDFKIDKPQASIPQLLEIRKEVSQLKDPFWKRVKLEEIDELIADCAGLFMEATAEDFSGTPNDSIKVQFQLLSRASEDVSIVSIASPELSSLHDINKKLAVNKNELLEYSYYVNNLPYTQPHWLKESGTLGMYKINGDKTLQTAAETGPSLQFKVTLSIANTPLIYTIPLEYKTNDPVKGEQKRAFIITPPVVVNFPETIHLFPGEVKKDISFTVKAEKDKVKGTLTFNSPSGWHMDQTSWEIALDKKGEEAVYIVSMTPTKEAENGYLEAVITTVEGTFTSSLQTIAYDHIPTQVMLPKAQTQLVYIDLKTTDIKIGYMEGAGDMVMDNLKTIGYDVDLLTEDDLNQEKLKEYNTIILGIRKLNVDHRVDFQMPALLEYVKNGGTLLIQYNTSHRLKTDNIGPYPLTLSRDRVTEEDAEVTILHPKHPVFNYPNKITEADFDNWVQERGLYFPNEWDKRYEALISWHDINETPKEGSLLVAEYGEGHYIYTGISFFRELPAGVPGAFRLLVNLISLGN